MISKRKNVTLIFYLFTLLFFSYSKAATNIFCLPKKKLDSKVKNSGYYLGMPPSKLEIKNIEDISREIKIFTNDDLVDFCKKYFSFKGYKTYKKLSYVNSFVFSDGSAPKFEAYTVIDKDAKTLFLKILNIRKKKNAEILNHIMMEIVAGCVLKHPNAINPRWIGFSRDYKKIKIAYDYIECGCLLNAFNYLTPKKKPGKWACFFPIELLVPVMFGVLGFLAYLEGQNLLHRGIKLENIYITKDGNVLVGDFGLITTSGVQKKYEESEFFLAPEEKSKMKMICCKSDMFELGLALMCLIDGPDFYTKKENTSDLENLVFDIFLRKDIELEIENLVKKMLKAEPKNRISASEALKSQIFKKYDCSPKKVAELMQKHFRIK